MAKLTFKQERTAQKVADRLFELVEDAYCETVGDLDPQLVDQILFGEDDELIDKFEAKAYRLLAKMLLK